MSKDYLLLEKQRYEGGVNAYFAGFVDDDDNYVIITVKGTGMVQGEEFFDIRISYDNIKGVEFHSEEHRVKGYLGVMGQIRRTLKKDVEIFFYDNLSYHKLLVAPPKDFLESTSFKFYLHKYLDRKMIDLDTLGESETDSLEEFIQEYLNDIK